MPAVSDKQANLFRMVTAYKKGKLDTRRLRNPKLLAKIRKIAAGISTQKAGEFTVRESKFNLLKKLLKEHINV